MFKYKKAVIVTGYVENIEKIKPRFLSGCDLVICADAGYKYLDSLHIDADIIIGDFDSADAPVKVSAECIKIPCEKDMTDTEAAFDIAVRKNPQEILIVGGLGGRFDHTLGNISLMRKFASSLHPHEKNETVPSISILDGNNFISLKTPGNHTFSSDDFKDYKYFSIYPLTKTAENVNLSGFKYDVHNAVLTNDSTHFISNEINSCEASVSFSSGLILVILSND